MEHQPLARVPPRIDDELMNLTAIAIDGGQPLLPDGPPGWPPPDAGVRAALIKLAEQGSWGQYNGPLVEQLAAELSAAHGNLHVYPCCSGTIAVELALRGLQVGPGDEVILAGYDFPGNFRSIEAVGALPVLVDIDPRSWTMDPALIEQAITPATRALVVSHLHGGLAPMAELLSLLKPHGIGVVEDACQCPGAMIDGTPAGQHGDVGIMSFGGSKLLSAGRGGALLTPHEDVYQRVKIFAERGNDAFALSELQACVLLPQLEKLEHHNQRRQQSVERLLAAVGETAGLVPIQIPCPGESADRNRGSYYKLAWLYQQQECGGPERETILAALQAEGVAIYAGFRGFARRRGRRCRQSGDLPHSQRAGEQTLILHHPVLLEEDQVVDLVAQSIQRVMDYYTRHDGGP
jgi:dTDP-4-amino-4,6-dideoxygalactose transaminase